ncbi:MAG: hypothetical protein GF347_03930 [Candidatus Moranbacteria bacterium]|nr:hypothetical protein [Candidatus Moranbacteria bacterium]
MKEYCSSMEYYSGCPKLYCKYGNFKVIPTGDPYHPDILGLPTCSPNPLRWLVPIVIGIIFIYIFYRKIKQGKQRKEDFLDFGASK